MNRFRTSTERKARLTWKWITYKSRCFMSYKCKAETSRSKYCAITNFIRTKNHSGFQKPITCSSMLDRVVALAFIRLIQKDFFILFAQIFIDCSVFDHFFEFSEIESTWILTSKHWYFTKYSTVKLFLDCSLKRLTKN